MLLSERDNIEFVTGKKLEILIDALRNDTLPDKTYEKLIGRYWHEMPYGTLKARTGDPYEWLLNKLERIKQ